MDENKKKEKKIKETNKYKEYSIKKAAWTQIIYLIFAICWVLLIAYLDISCMDRIGLLILGIPLFTFAIAYMNSNSLTIEVEEDMFRANFLSVGLLIILPLLTWISKDYSGDRPKFTCILVLSLILTLLSLIDIWIRKKWFSLIKHIKSALQTLSITLIIYALYVYYIEKKNFGFKCNKENFYGVL